MRELNLGMSGDDVARWERFLVREKRLRNEPRGFFGPCVAAATEAFQKTNALAPTGRADAPTLAAALSQGLLDPSLDEPRAAAPAEAAKGPRRADLGAVGIAIAAAVGTFLTNVAVEWVKHSASIEAEREKLRSSLIQQALRVETPSGGLPWSQGQAQVEVVSRLQGYVRLGLVMMPPGTLEGFLRDFGSVPVTLAARAAAATAPPDGTPRPTTGADAPPPTPSQRVFVQFAGTIQREEIIRMARELSSAWRVQGADRGGERTGTAAGFKEVRWGHPDDEPAAKALADAVERTRIIPGEVGTQRIAAIPKGTLEIWISR